MRHPAQLLNVNHFRQRCMKARPNTSISPYYSNRQITFVLFPRSGAPGEIRTPGLLVRSQTLYPTELRARSKTLHCQQFTASSSSISTSSFGSFGGTCEDSLDALSI